MAANRPTPAMEGTTPRELSGVKRSASRTTTMVTTSTISGAKAWKSTSGRRNGVPAWSRAASTVAYLPSAWKVSPIAVMTGSVTWKMRLG